MIGNRFARHLKDVPPRTMPRLNLFTRFVQTKIDDAQRRAKYFTPNGYGSRLLTEIIKLADLDYLLADRPLDQQYASYLLSITKDLEKPIDVRIGKHTTNVLFINSKTPCFELMTASRRSNPLEEIPYGLPWGDERWLSVKPLRVNDMGHADLTYQVYNDLLSYRQRGPTHVVYSLDCFALVCKFVAYYRAQTNVTNIDQCILDYTHNEIIIPALLNDSLAIWLRNVYQEQFLTYSPLESHSSTVWDVVNIDNIGSDFTGAMVDIQHLRDDLRKQSVTDHTVFASLILSGKGDSFVNYYKDLFYTTQTPNEQPYAWVDCLKNLSWWNFIVTIASIAPSLPDVISLKRDAYRDVKFWLMFKPWQSIHGSIPYRTSIRAKLEGLYFYLNDA